MSADAHPLTLGFLTLGALPQIEVVQAAADAGFAGVSLRVTGRALGDAWPALPAGSEACTAVAQAARRAGLCISNLSTYYLDGRTRPEDWAPALATAEALDCRLFVQGCFDPDRARLVDRLGATCRLAAREGVRIGLEFMPPSMVKTLDDSLAVIEAVGAPNLGLVLDALHAARAGVTPQRLAALAEGPWRDRILLFQLCDAPAAPPADLWQEAIEGRLYAGQGGLPLAAMLAALPPGCEIECEMPCAADRHLPATERAARARDSAVALLAGMGRRSAG